ncbi:hypothetical protein D9M69_550770 [compost metagenome]
MPHALSQLSDYWKHCFRSIIAEDLSLKTESLPSGALEIVMAAAPTVDPETFKAIRTLVTSSQIFESRFRSAQTRKTTAMLPTLLIDLASLDYHTDGLYDFSRFESDKVELSPPVRQTLSNQIYNRLDLHDRACATEAKRLRIESALNSTFKSVREVLTRL